MAVFAKRGPGSKLKTSEWSGPPASNSCAFATIDVAQPHALVAAPAAGEIGFPSSGRPDKKLSSAVHSVPSKCHAPEVRSLRRQGSRNRPRGRRQSGPAGPRRGRCRRRPRVAVGKSPTTQVSCAATRRASVQLVVANDDVEIAVAIQIEQANAIVAAIGLARSDWPPNRFLSRRSPASRKLRNFTLFPCRWTA